MTVLLTAGPLGADADLAAVRSRLLPLTLSELDARAGLLERQDVKYLVREGQAAALLAELADRYQVLDIDGRRDFVYDSAYVDTPGLDLYRQHAQGRRLRWKARTRRYGGGPLCYREIKLKGARGATVKLRERCPAHEHGVVGAALTAFVDTALRQHYGRGLDVPLSTTLSVRYERTTLVSVDGAERITLDRNLAVVDPSGRLRGGLQPGLVLLEVKTPRGRGQADRALAARGLRPVSVSKYGVGVALAYPHVGHHRLRPVLRRGFQQEPAPPA